MATQNSSYYTYTVQIKMMKEETTSVIFLETHNSFGLGTDLII